MSKIVISELEEATQVQDTDFLAIDNGESTKKITVENFENTATASARAYAEQAAASAASAENSAEAASATSDEVALQINRAVELAGQAEGYADEAGVSAGAAASSASIARSQAAYAEAKAAEAAQTASDLHDEVQMSKSWAVGGTGVRQDEETNNAQYWASVAKAIAGGGVVSFKGRGGAVVPKSGDYNSAMITHGNGSNVNREFESVHEEMNDIHDDTDDLQDQINAINAKTIVQTKTLNAGARSLTFTVSQLKSTSLVSIYSDTFGITPTGMSVSGTTITLSFDAYDTNVVMTVEVFNP